MFGTCKFADIAKPSNDLLNDDYTSKVTLKCKKNAGPVAVTIETDQGEGGALSSKVGTKFAYANFNVDKGQFTADGGRVMETSLNINPNVKMSFKSNKGADVGIDYTKGGLYATGTLDVMEMSKLSTSACVGVGSGVKVGGDATYALSGGSGLSSFTLGASYSTGPLYASMTATNKCSTFNLGCTYKVSDDLTLASKTVHSSAKMIDCVAMGGAYKVGGVGTLKAKVGSDGNVSACVIHEIAPKVTLVASGSVSSSDFSTFKPGLSITM